MSDRVKIAIAFLLLGVVFCPIFPELWKEWTHNSDNSHGLLVPLVSLYFIWERRDELSTTKIVNSSWGLLTLAVTLFMYILTLWGGVAFGSRILFVVAIIGMVLSLYGPAIFRVIKFPLLFLFFMVPVPQSLISIVALPLQLFATRISAGLIHACSIPVYREGNMLYFVQTQLEVAEACSGIRSIVSLLMLSTIFVYLSKKGKLQKIVLLCSAIPVAILANILRVSGTGVLAHFYGDQVARGFLHEFSGMVVFLFGLMVMFLEYVILNKILKKS